MTVAQRLRPFGTTVFAEITAAARSAKAVDLGQGAPDFDGPEWLKDAAVEAFRSRSNQYAPLPGLPELRAALAERHDAGGDRAGGGTDPDTEVTVTGGATEALAATCLGLLEPGDEVVLFEPYYDAYRADLSLADASPLFVSLRPDAAGVFRYDQAELERAAARPRCRALILNTPHNPTGRVFDDMELRCIADLAKQHDLVVIADEVYEHVVFDGFAHRSIASLPGMRARTIRIGSIGKTFNMTGWKVGWAIAPAELSGAVRSAHQFLTFCVPPALQAAAAVGIRRLDEWGPRVRAEFQAKRDVLSAGLRRVGLEPLPAEGGWFVLADHRGVSRDRGIEDDVGFVRWLIAEVGVAAIPPSAFCAHPEPVKHLARFAFCKRDETIAAAIERLERKLLRV